MLRKIATTDKGSGVYQIRNLVNGKVYVGSAVNFSGRKKEHLSKLRRGLHHSPKLQSAWNKYGHDCFSFEVLEDVHEKLNLFVVEQKHINQSMCVQFGYNICPTAGSTLGRKASEETKRKMSETRLLLPDHVRARPHLGKLPRTEEWKKKIAQAKLGKKASEETKQKMRQAKLKEPQDVKEKRAIAIRASDAARGGRHSDESRQKISASLKGRFLSESHRQAIKLSWEKRKAGKLAQPSQ